MVQVLVRSAYRKVKLLKIQLSFRNLKRQLKIRMLQVILILISDWHFLSWSYQDNILWIYWLRNAWQRLPTRQELVPTTFPIEIFSRRFKGKCDFSDVCFYWLCQHFGVRSKNGLDRSFHAITLKNTFS